MKSSDGGFAGSPEKRLTARSNDPHQALTGVERPRNEPVTPPGSTRHESTQRRTWTPGHGRSRRASVSSIQPVSTIGVLLRRRVDLDVTAERADRRQHLPRDCRYRSVGRQGGAPDTSVVVLDERSWLRRSSATTSAPEPSGAGSGSVSQPRAVCRSAGVLQLAAPAERAWRQACPEPACARGSVSQG